MLIFLRTKENLGICPARASKNLVGLGHPRTSARHCGQNIRPGYRSFTETEKISWIDAFYRATLAFHEKNQKFVKAFFDTRAVTTTVSHW